MSAPSPPPLTLTTETGPGTLCVQVSGVLDYDTAEQLIQVVRSRLDSSAALRHLHLDFGALTLCDSMGLSALLMVHRHATQLGVQLHLDRRPGFLERILNITGTLRHLTAVADGSPETAQCSDHSSVAGAAARTATTGGACAEASAPRSPHRAPP